MKPDIAVIDNQNNGRQSAVNETRKAAPMRR